MTSRGGLALFFGLPVALFGAAYLVISRSTPHSRTVAQVPSPDGRRNAVVVRIEAPSQPPVDAVRIGDEDAFVAFGAKGFVVRWRDARTLEVAFGHALATRAGKVADLEVVPVGTVERTELP